jgi:predicted RNA-binding Zn ribbon-like protein
MPTLTPPAEPHAAAGPHDHATDLEACLALVNTLELSDGVPVDALPTRAAALAWLVEHGLGHAGPLADQADLDGDAWLARVHGVRAAIRIVWDAVVDGRSPGAPALEVLNATLAAAPVLELYGDGGTVLVGHRHRVGDPTGEALARLVTPLVAAVAAGDTGRFRVCANDGCRWVFEDTSRSGRRRWCDMTTCGNRAKVRRFRSRRRAGSGDGGNGA